MKSGYEIDHQYFDSIININHVFVFNWDWCNTVCHHYAWYSESGNKRSAVIGQWNVKHKELSS